MRRQNRSPQRTCLGCAKRDEKSVMIRIAVAQNEIRVDELQTMAGRGGYLHSEEACLRKFVRSKVREFRSIRRKIPLDERERITELIRSAAG
jgi:predicted RNA-binding protein YlxR (DUF448 family)